MDGKMLMWWTIERVDYLGEWKVLKPYYTRKPIHLAIPTRSLKALCIHPVITQHHDREKCVINIYCRRSQNFLETALDSVHFRYNSTIFAQTTVIEYNIYNATEKFFTNSSTLSHGLAETSSLLLGTP